MAQTHRSLFVDATLRCPVMSTMLSKKADNEKKGNFLYV